MRVEVFSAAEQWDYAIEAAACVRVLEAGDWHRFKNRRQVSSYLGLCPSENSSGSRQHPGHITKCGNPRLRWAFGELAWRLLRDQPNYRLCQKWRAQILDPKTPGGRKKQLVTAMAQGFGVEPQHGSQMRSSRFGSVPTVN